MSSDRALLLTRLRDALPALCRDALQRDAEGSFPVAEIRLLQDEGLLQAFLDDEEPSHLLQALRLLGRANLSLGRIFEGHVNGIKLVGWYGTDGQRSELAAALGAGRVFGVWNTEPTPGVRLVKATDGWRLEGKKCFATGAGHIDRAVITASDSKSARQMILLDVSDPARADNSGWRVRGMKATLSGLYDFTGMTVRRSDLLGGAGDYEREPRFSSGAWRFTAVQLGGIERVLSLLREHLKSGPGAADPVQRARFGESLAATRSAYLWVQEAARRAEAPGAGAAEVAFVLLTRGIVERAGLAVMDAASRSIGTRAFFTDHPVDLACRDLALYLRQPAPDQALDRAAVAFLERDCWRDDPLW